MSKKCKPPPRATTDLDLAAFESSAREVVQPDIPFFGCAREYGVLSERVQQRVDEVLASGKLLQGAEIARFESELTKFTGEITLSQSDHVQTRCSLLFSHSELGKELKCWFLT